jgi:hypothetical protein
MRKSLWITLALVLATFAPAVMADGAPITLTVTLTDTGSAPLTLGGTVTPYALTVTGGMTAVVVIGPAVSLPASLSPLPAVDTIAEHLDVPLTSVALGISFVSSSVSFAPTTPGVIIFNLPGPGFEKAFLDGNASAELRTPIGFVGTVSSLDPEVVGTWGATFSPVPEPDTVLLLGAGLLGLSLMLLRKRIVPAF